MKIPTVTADDLAAYHLRVYSRPAPPNSLPGSINPQINTGKRKRSEDYPEAPEDGKTYQENGDNQSDGDEGEADWEGAEEEYAEYDEDDGLGYYPDGVKRTLTDEQIAMFRHSELYAIQRQQERAKEKRDAEEEETEDDEDGEIEEDDGTFQLQHEEPDDATIQFGKSLQTSDNLKISSTPEAQRAVPTPTQTLRNTANSRTSRRKRNRLRAVSEKADETNKERQSRAQVRELDAAAQQDDQALNYGDDEMDHDEEPTPLTVNITEIMETKETPEGRKIWWPVLSG